MLSLIIVLALASPVVAIIAFVMAIGIRRRLRAVESDIRQLEQRFIQMRNTGFASPVDPQTLSRTPAAGTTSSGDVEIASETPKAADAAPADAAKATPEENLVHTEAEPSPPSSTVEIAHGAAPSLEERFGTRWVVWTGGLALALGGIFLVQFSIEQGLLGAGTRVFLGALLAASLVAVGEWLRRSERRSKFIGLPAVHIPSILTAAGTTVAYATVYAAYGLYGFVNPATALVLLGVVALATMIAALLHGPALAALGLIGAFVTPLLVASQPPNYWALTIYLAVVTAASFSMARARNWRWLAITAASFGVLWMLPGIMDTSAAASLPHAAHAIIGFLLAATLVVSGFLLGPDAEPGRVEKLSSGVLTAYIFAGGFFVIAQNHDVIAFATFGLLVAAAVRVAFRAEAATGAVPAAAVLVALVMLDWALDVAVASGIVAAGPAYYSAIESRLAANQAHIFVGTGFAALFGLGGYLAQGRSERATAPILWATSAVAAPLAILIALYLRLAGYERSIPFAAAALGLAALFAAVTEQLSRRQPRPGLASATAIFACGAVAGLALALTLALEKGWLSVALALMVPGIAWVADKRRLPALRWVAVALILLVVGRIAWEPQIVGSELGTTPIFNWLLWGYGVPACSFWLAGMLLRRRQDDIPARIADSAAILFSVLFAFLEIRHFMTGGDIYAERTSLVELALQVSSALAIAIGLERLRARTQNAVHDIAALVVAALALFCIVVGLALVENPLTKPIDIGGMIINLNLLGYALPAVLVAVLGLTAHRTRPNWYGAIAATTALVLVLLYLTLQVRRFFQGPVLAFGSISDPEQYAYSVVWLVFGIFLIIFGVAFRSHVLRLASAAVMLATVGKVFLIDMGDLTGGLRALSFIGLGLVLVAIGWLYQRVLFPRWATQPTDD